MRRTTVTLTCLGISLMIASGCSTPKHSNTLIFGTNTKIALDVSQDPVNGVGVTLGYKRQEAVWMPLLANEDSSGKLVPQKCTSEPCKRFVGTSGGGGAAGSDAEDTYSVLATFQGNAAGEAGTAATAPNAKAGGSLAQYFATGFAARLLAGSGSGVVNTAGNSTPANSVLPAVHKANEGKLKSRIDVINDIMKQISDGAGNLDKAKKDTLVNKATFSSEDTKQALLRETSGADFRDLLLLSYDGTAKPLDDALNGGK